MYFCFLVKNKRMIAVQEKNRIPFKTPTGSTLLCKGWVQEAALRMLLNNLDPSVAERPEELIVYGGRGKAARNQEALENIIRSLMILENDESLLIQSGPCAIEQFAAGSPLG
jgi:urocanate hydratase